MNRQHKVIFNLGVLTTLSSFILASCFALKSNAMNLLDYQPDNIGSSVQYQHSATTWLKRGIAKAVGGDYQAAISNYNQALQLDSKNPDTYYNRGVAYYSLGQHQQALTDFNQSIKLNPALAEAYGNRAHLHIEQGDKQRAIKDCHRAAKLFTLQGDGIAAEQMQAMSKELRQ
jgi:tetratricopeptide (TPR) repeat protein